MQSKIHIGPVGQIISRFSYFSWKENERFITRFRLSAYLRINTSLVRGSMCATLATTPTNCVIFIYAYICNVVLHYSGH